MKKSLILFLLILNFISAKNYQEILLDACEFNNYRMEIREIKKKQKTCYLYFFKKDNNEHKFYRCYDLKISTVAYFKGYYDTHRKIYNKKGQWYTVKKKNIKFKVYFLDFSKIYSNSKNLQKPRLVKNTLGTLRIVGGEEVKVNKKSVKERFGRGTNYLPNAFYGRKGFGVVLLKNGDIFVYTGKKDLRKNRFISHLKSSKYDFQVNSYYSIAETYAMISGKYPEIDYGYDPKENIDICPQITPPKKSQKPMLNAKIKPYKNLAGNRIE